MNKKITTPITLVVMALVITSAFFTPNLALAGDPEAPETSSEEDKNLLEQAVDFGGDVVDAAKSGLDSLKGTAEAISKADEDRKMLAELHPEATELSKDVKTFWEERAFWLGYKEHRFLLVVLPLFSFLWMLRVIYWVRATPLRKRKEAVEKAKRRKAKRSKGDPDDYDEDEEDTNIAEQRKKLSQAHRRTWAAIIICFITCMLSSFLFSRFVVAPAELNARMGDKLTAFQNKCTLQTTAFPEDICNPVILAETQLDTVWGQIGAAGNVILDKGAKVAKDAVGLNEVTISLPDGDSPAALATRALDPSGLPETLNWGYGIPLVALIAFTLALSIFTWWKGLWFSGRAGMKELFLFLILQYDPLETVTSPSPNKQRAKAAITRPAAEEDTQQEEDEDTEEEAETEEDENTPPTPKRKAKPKKKATTSPAPIHVDEKLYQNYLEATAPRKKPDDRGSDRRFQWR